jgi:hypothetical protein
VINTNWRRRPQYFDSWNVHNCWGLPDYNMKNEKQMKQMIENVKTFLLPELKRINIDYKKLLGGEEPTMRN